jgi:hypothetical protein
VSDELCPADFRISVRFSRVVRRSPSADIAASPNHPWPSAGTRREPTTSGRFHAIEFGRNLTATGPASSHRFHHPCHRRFRRGVGERAITPLTA